ncbi:hypothetical protein Glove_209g123 [Diversispora epigaea]|uniref:Uncharacterized protein n=1 Tax=Diversispora epigaea TaxID=1348612 RepID=A0A397IS70_9GLOM|nr:hypothetical protein Glove_209g123 [Diversispora epigaea]
MDMRCVVCMSVVYETKLIISRKIVSYAYKFHHSSPSMLLKRNLIFNHTCIYFYIFTMNGFNDFFSPVLKESDLLYNTRIYKKKNNLFMIYFF